MYNKQQWRYKALIGKNSISGQVYATNKSEAIVRGFKAIHTRYPHSLVILFENSVNVYES